MCKGTRTFDAALSLKAKVWKHKCPQEGSGYSGRLCTIKKTEEVVQILTWKDSLELVLAEKSRQKITPNVAVWALSTHPSPGNSYKLWAKYSDNDKLLRTRRVKLAVRLLKSVKTFGVATGTGCISCIFIGFFLGFALKVWVAKTWRENLLPFWLEKLGKEAEATMVTGRTPERKG